MKKTFGSATESRTPVSALRGPRPGPLDDSATGNAYLPDRNPGSSPNASASGPTNESLDRSTGTQTSVCCPDVSIPENKLQTINSTLSGTPTAAQSEAPTGSAPVAQPSLFDQPLRFDGATYLPWRDDERLGKQWWRVFLLMRDGAGRTLRQIADITGAPEPSASAQLRHARKTRFGGHKVEKEHLGSGLYVYRLIENTEWTGAIASRCSNSETPGADSTGRLIAQAL